MQKETEKSSEKVQTGAEGRLAERLQEGERTFKT